MDGPLSRLHRLRQNFTERRDSRQAVNQVVKALVAAGHFEVARLFCPDSGRMCKRLKLCRIQ